MIAAAALAVEALHQSGAQRSGEPTI
jgi:hypothetical protein